MDVTLLEMGDEAGRADFKLMRLVEFAGFSLDQFQRTSDPLLLADSSNVILGMGYNAARHYHLHDLLGRRGYCEPLGDGRWLIPTIHPTFIQRGQSRWSAAFIADLQKAVQLSLQGMPPQVVDYRLDPSPLAAYQWAKEYLLGLSMDPRTRLAFDIETPGKGDDEEDLDLGEDGHDRTWKIDRIGFSYKPLGALSIPWAPEYTGTIRALMGSEGEKVVWNAGFDVPRIKRAGVVVGGLVHDAMVAWHILHSDLPKSLKFVATFTCPWQPAWKHLSGARPAFYNATDADVELRAMLKIEEELKRTDLWDVYQRDVIDLEPILVHMSQMGMPVDNDIREDRAKKLAVEQKRVLSELELLVPMEARKIEHVYKTTPKDITDLRERPGHRVVTCCGLCGVERPRKDHFKSFKKKLNPCAGGEVVERTIEVTEYYRLADFTPSRDQLIRYHYALKRPLPTTLDKKTRQRKVSFGESQIKKLILLYPDDKLYPLILDFREIQKLASTYIGYPILVEGEQNSDLLVVGGSYT